MTRFIWFFAGMNLALHNVLTAVQGPYGMLGSLPQAAWSIVFLAGAGAWVFMAIEAARGRF